MKRALGIYFGILALLLMAATGWRMHPVEPEGSELYERCKDVPGVRVGFVKDYPVNDSVTCDVTTVEALTDEGWEWMVKEFDMQKMIDQWDLMDSVDAISGRTFSPEDAARRMNFWYSIRNHPELWGSRVEDSADDKTDCVVASPPYRWVAAFHASSLVQEKSIMHSYIRLQRSMDKPPLPKKTEAIQ